jgi:hypothetical protein
MGKPILCVDFDGVIHSYKSGWKGADIIPDPPVPGALAWLLRATEFWEVHIYSSRSKEPAGIAAMKNWFTQHGNGWAGGIDKVLLACLKFSSEKPAAFLTIDDRAICFEGDWSELDPQELLKFKPWNKRDAT